MYWSSNDETMVFVPSGTFCPMSYASRGALSYYPGKPQCVTQHESLDDERCTRRQTTSLVIINSYRKMNRTKTVITIFKGKKTM